MCLHLLQVQPHLLLTFINSSEWTWVSLWCRFINTSQINIIPLNERNRGNPTRMVSIFKLNFEFMAIDRWIVPFSSFVHLFIATGPWTVAYRIGKSSVKLMLQWFEIIDFVANDEDNEWDLLKFGAESLMLPYQYRQQNRVKLVETLCQPTEWNNNATLFLIYLDGLVWKFRNLRREALIVFELSGYGEALAVRTCVILRRMSEAYNYLSIATINIEI